MKKILTKLGGLFILIFAIFSISNVITTSYATVSFSNVAIESTTDDSLICVGNANRTAGIIMTIFQMIFTVVAILCFIKGIHNIIKNTKEKKLIEQNQQDKAEEQGELCSGKYATIKHENKELVNHPVLGFFITSGVLTFISMMLEIVSNFAAKPIIYIYPEEEKEVTVKLKNSEKLTCSYPRYDKGWKVLAKPNGDLVDLKTNRKLYALYWEGLNTNKPNFKEGFIVEGEKVAEFLEEKLEILGLNEKEAEEFIVYWLPLMEKNKYNYVRFETMEEINENMGLEIVPSPETLIRINMEFKGLRKPIGIQEQKLEKVSRKGYTVVEWGGTRV